MNSKFENRSDGANQPTRNRVVMYLIVTMADTTWRMFIPVIGLFLAGFWLDKQLNSSPWWMICGIIVGSVLAGLLIRQQLKRSAPEGLSRHKP